MQSAVEAVGVPFRQLLSLCASLCAVDTVSSLAQDCSHAKYLQGQAPRGPTCN